MTKIKFGAQTIIPAGEHEALVQNGTLYVAVVTGLPETTDSGAGEEEEEKPVKGKAASRPVADDTKPSGRTKKAVDPEPEPEEEQEEKPAPTARKSRVSKPAKQEEPEGPVEIPMTAWKKLKAGTTLLARVLTEDGEPMTDPDNDNSEFFSVEVIEVDKAGNVTIMFHCDEEQTVLQEGDQLFEFNADFA